MDGQGDWADSVPPKTRRTLFDWGEALFWLGLWVFGGLIVSATSDGIPRFFSLPVLLAIGLVAAMRRLRNPQYSRKEWLAEYESRSALKAAYERGRRDGAAEAGDAGEG